MRLRDKFQQLEDFVAELGREDISENVATERTADKAKRLGIDVDDARKLFEQHYAQGHEEPKRKELPARRHGQRKQQLRLKSKVKPTPKRPARSTYQLGDVLPLKKNFNRFHRAFWCSADVCELPNLAHRALHCLFAQWNGYTDESSNHSRLKATVKWMWACGWGTCNDKSLAVATTELLKTGLVRLVKKRKYGRPALYALVYLEDLIRGLKSE